MFHIFNNQQERRNYGGSEFLEFQYCRLEPGTGIKDIVAVHNINNWCNDSLYLHDDDVREFKKQYKDIFDNAIYNGLSQGPMDSYGINYYPPEQLENIISAIENEKPEEYEILLEWLIKGKEYNGIYILGI